jgi:hypothetical protein
MKRTLSAPNLAGLKVPATPKMRKSPSTQAFLGGDDFFMTINSELQAEAIMHVPGAQAAICGLSSSKFPYEILQNDGPIESFKELAVCLLDQTDQEPPPPRIQTWVPCSYLDMCESDAQLAQRYAAHLKRVRKKKQ